MFLQRAEMYESVCEYKAKVAKLISFIRSSGLRENFLHLLEILGLIELIRLINARQCVFVGPSVECGWVEINQQQVMFAEMIVSCDFSYDETN